MTTEQAMQAMNVVDYFKNYDMLTTAGTIMFIKTNSTGKEVYAASEMLRQLASTLLEEETKDA